MNILKKSILLISLIFLSLLCIFSAEYINTLQLFSFPISPLLLAIVFGMVLGNIVSIGSIPAYAKEWKAIHHFSSKTLLRIGIVLFGFSITLSEIFELGIIPVIIACFVVASTLFIGFFIGRKILKMDDESIALVSCGSAICGAAAILATESTLKTKQTEKVAVSIALITLFGTLAMVLFPFVFSLSIFNLSDYSLGLILGGTIHEVAQVVASGNIISVEVAQGAVLIKMIRVLLLVPVLFVLVYMLQNKKTSQESKYSNSSLISFIPSFVFLFLIVIIIHSYLPLPSALYEYLKILTTFLFTISLLALGMGTQFSDFKKVGGKFFALGFILFLWLMTSGVLITLFLHMLLP